MNILRVAVVQAGLSNPSTTSRLADALQKAMVSQAEAAGFAPDVARINLREIAVRVTEATLSGVKSEEVEAALQAVTSAHVVIAVSPTFNASYSGIFKGFFDLIEPRGLDGTVVVLGATGGTARHSLVVDKDLRPLFTYLRAMPVPTSIFASAEDFAGRGSIGARAEVTAREALALLGAGGSGGSASAAGSVGSVGSASGSDGIVPGQPHKARTSAAADAGMSGAEVLDSPVGEFVPFSEIARGLGK